MPFHSRPPTAAPRSTAEVAALTEHDFPADFCEDEHQVLELSHEDWASLSNYFDFYGLRLPIEAHAQTAFDLWRELRLTYGPLVRLASNGREAHTMPDPTTPAQRAYAVAVGTQNRALAQRLARGLFSGRHASLFLV